MARNSDKIKALELSIDTGIGSGRRPNDVIAMANAFYIYFMEIPDEQLQEKREEENKTREK